MKIVLTGGGTGGHLVPLAVVAKKIKEKKPEVEFIFIGPNGKLENEIMKAENIEIRNILVGKMRRYFSFSNVIDFFKIPIGFIQSLFWLLVHMPDAVFSKGGYASAPVVLAAWLYRIPVMIHESDAAPGMANSMLGKFSHRIAISYPQAEKYFLANEVVLTGNPLRQDIASGDVQKAREKFSLTETRKTIFVWGGSQGSQLINTKILHILPDLLKKYQIIHQTGENNFKDVEKVAGELGIKAGHGGYHAIPYIGEELKDILAVADLVVTRAGANSISEIAANSKPSIIIPLESSANDHQRMNAYSLAKIGACIVMEENNLGEHLLLTRIEEAMTNEDLRKKMIEGIKTFYHPDAAEKIADGVIAMIK